MSIVGIDRAIVVDAVSWKPSPDSIAMLGNCTTQTPYLRKRFPIAQTLPIVF
ncbi:hypothetical protein [Nostoc sp.]|uniref:hypothetical protein n=1 Tax=Nostoc sp. TaxID=1180 RepID=UPI002FF67EDB